MPLICPLTGIKYQKIHKRSHSMQSTITRRKPNFVIKKIGNKKVKITARGLRTLKKKSLKLANV